MDQLVDGVVVELAVVEDHEVEVHAFVPRIFVSDRRELFFNCLCLIWFNGHQAMDMH